MKKRDKKIFSELKEQGLSPEQEEKIRWEIELDEQEKEPDPPPPFKGVYAKTDFDILPGYYRPSLKAVTEFKTLDELLDKDNQREKDGFPRRIRLGRLIKPSKDKDTQVIVVPTTTEPKFYHDDSVTEEQEEETGGSGEGDEGEVIGEQPVQPQQGEGEGQGAGKGEGGEHDISQEAFDLGKILTEKFELPNLKDKGKKYSFVKYIYDLTDMHRGFGQYLEKKETLKQMIKTNLQLGKITPDNINLEDMIISPDDKVYRIMSKEKDFESQAIVFFLRDYSGSMQGKPTEVVTQQHLFIYSWLMYQYANRVETRFILHDTEAKEVDDFLQYYQYQVAGGTRIAPAFDMVNDIVENERLHVDYNIYVFHGTDGDDWDEDGRQMIDAVKKMFSYVNRIGITVAKNSWSRGGPTTIERYMDRSGLLKEQPELIKLDQMPAEEAQESRIIDGIKKLVE